MQSFPPYYFTFLIFDYEQLTSEHQTIEASPTPSAPADDLMPPPPSYDEINNTFTAHTYDDSTDVVDYFLGEVITLLYIKIYFCSLFGLNKLVCDMIFFLLTVSHKLLQAMYSFRGVSDVELSLSIGDYVVVRKVVTCFQQISLHFPPDIKSIICF